MTKRKNTIDVIKGIAIILVIITHFEWTEDQRKYFVFPFIINMAIPTFMIITGYVYSISLKKNMEKPGCINSTVEDAYDWLLIVKRVARYTIPLIPVIVWELVDPKMNAPTTFMDILRWAIVGTVGSGSYYYPVMMQLIFLFPVIYFIIERKNERGFLICLIINAVYELLAWAYKMNIECYRFLVFRYIFLIAAGVYAFHGYKLKLFIGLAMTVIGAAFISAVTYLGYEPRIVNGPWATTNFISSMLIIPIMIWILPNLRIRFLPLEIIGRASYHIFLVQMMYYRGYYEKLQNRFLTWQGHLIAGIVICLTLGVAFYYIEKPLQDWVQRLLSSHFNE